MKTLCIIPALLFNVSFSQPAYSNEGAYKCIDDELVEHVFIPELNDEEWLLQMGDGLSLYPITHKSEKYILSEKPRKFGDMIVLDYIRKSVNLYILCSHRRCMEDNVS